MREDKEAGHAGDLADIFSSFLRRFQSLNVRLSDFDVGILRKKQSNVDVDAFTGQLANRRHAFRRSRNFDHDVGPGYGSSIGGALLR